MRKSWFYRLVAYLRQQAFSRELIVAGDGSSDGTSERVDQIVRCRRTDSRGKYNFAG